jgi:hypothetical protein
MKDDSKLSHNKLKFVCVWQCQKTLSISSQFGANFMNKFYLLLLLMFTYLLLTAVNVDDPKTKTKNSA